MKAIPIKNTLTNLTDEQLAQFARMQNVIFDAVQRLKNAEEELLKKIFEHYSGEKLDFDTPGKAAEQGARLGIVFYEGEANRYKITFDGKQIGQVERDFTMLVVRFTPVDRLAKLVITDDGIKERED
jgi:hypothetical protein